MQNRQIKEPDQAGLKSEKLPTKVSSSAGQQSRSPSALLLRLQSERGNRSLQQALLRAAEAEHQTVVPDRIQREINEQRGSGQPLESSVRAQMETALASDFSGVRVHTDAHANKLSIGLKAVAFTTGQDLFFRDGEYSPRTLSGRQLLAHELVHVVQQRGASVQGQLALSQPSDESEEEADRLAQDLAKNEPAAQLGESDSSRNVISRAGTMRLLQRKMTVPLKGWGGVPTGMDESVMLIEPRASLTAKGKSETLDFSKGQREQFTLSADSSASLRIAASVIVHKDNVMYDDFNFWYGWLEWHVRADDSGKLSISAPTNFWTGGTGTAPWMLQRDALQTASSVGLALTLTSTESTSSGHSVGGGVTGDLKPLGVGAGASGSYAHTWGTTTGPTLTAGRGFVVDLQTALVKIGPISSEQTMEFYFDTGRATLKGLNPKTHEDQNKALTGLLASLESTDSRYEGGSNVSGFVTGYASSIGDTEKNRKLAKDRANYILDRIHDVLPKASFDRKVYGEDLWWKKGFPEVENSQKHRFVLLKVTRTFSGE